METLSQLDYAAIVVVIRLFRKRPNKSVSFQGFIGSLRQRLKEGQEEEPVLERRKTTVGSFRGVQDALLKLRREDCDIKELNDRLSLLLESARILDREKGSGNAQLTTSLLTLYEKVAVLHQHLTATDSECVLVYQKLQKLFLIQFRCCIKAKRRVVLQIIEIMEDTIHKNRPSRSSNSPVHKRFQRLSKNHKSVPHTPSPLRGQCKRDFLRSLLQLLVQLNKDLGEETELAQSFRKLQTYLNANGDPELVRLLLRSKLVITAESAD